MAQIGWRGGGRRVDEEMNKEDEIKGVDRSILIHFPQHPLPCLQRVLSSVSFGVA